MTSHKVVVTRHGGPDVLRLVACDVPQPAPGEARVRVRAAGVSAYDLMFRRSGRLPGTPKVPFTLGTDVVGTVDALGAGVSDAQVGQLVAGMTLSKNAMGGYAEHVCSPWRELVPVPEGVDPVQAACVVVNYLTAQVMILDAAKAQPGEKALVHGGAGGVGSALVQLCLLRGLEVIATASTRNQEAVAAMGATPIDYRNEDFVARVRALTGEGVDIVFDPVGGARQLWRSYRTLRKGGRLVWFGVAATRDRGLRIIPATLAMKTALALLPDGKRVPTAPDLGKIAQRDNARYRSLLAELLADVAAGRLRPLVAATVPLAEAARAHELLERGGHIGKVVLVTGGDD